MALLLRADRDTYPVRGPIAELARAAGGTYDAQARAWGFGENQELYNQAMALKKAQELQRNGGNAALDEQRLPARAIVHAFVDSENDHEFYGFQRDTITDLMLSNEVWKAGMQRQTDPDLAARNIQRMEVYENGDLVFANRADRDAALEMYNAVLSDARNKQRQEIEAQLGGIAFSHEATHLFAKDFRELGGTWHVLGGQHGYWHFEDVEKGQQAQELFKEFLSQAPSISDPNAQFVKRDLAQLGWFKRDIEPPGWLFPNDAALEQANALVAKARSLEPSPTDSQQQAAGKARLKSSIFTVATLATPEESRTIFGFDPTQEPERLQYLDRASAQDALTSAREIFIQRDLNLDIKLHEAAGIQRSGTVSEIVTSAAMRHELSGDRSRPEPTAYRAEHDEQGIIKRTAPDVAGLLTSAREQMALDGVTPNFRLGEAPQTTPALGNLIAVNERYAVLAVPQLDTDHLPVLNYAVLDRTRIHGTIAQDDDRLKAVADAHARVAVLNRKGWTFLRGSSTDERSLAEFSKGVDAAAAGLQPAVLTPADKALRMAVIDQAKTIMAPLRQNVDAERAQLFAARARDAAGGRELSPAQFDRLPAQSLTEVQLETDSRAVLHGQLVGNYGQRRDETHGWLPPASKNFIAVVDERQPSVVTVFDARACDTDFGNHANIRRALADKNATVTVGWVDTHLVVAGGKLSHDQLASRREHWLANAKPERQRTITVEDTTLEVGSYDSILRDDRELAQRRGCEELARRSGTDVATIRQQLENRGRDASTAGALGFAGFGAHHVQPQKNPRYIGAEVISIEKYHMALVTTQRIGARSFTSIDAFERADLQLHDQHREPKLGERINIEFESGMIKTCELHQPREHAVARAAERLSGVKQPNYVDDHTAELAIAAGVAKRAVVTAAERGLIAKSEQADRLIQHQDVDFSLTFDGGRYDGQVFRLGDLARGDDAERQKLYDNYYVQLLENDTLVLHDRNAIEAPIENGSHATIKYRDGKPIPLDVTNLEDHRRDLLNQQRPAQDVPSQAMDLGR